MSDYISRNEAYQELHEARCCDMTDKWGRGYNSGITEAMDIINNIISPADVAPVVHGHWIYDYAYDEEWYICSICKRETQIPGYDFCPRCGAKMDESEDSTDE